MRHLFYKVFTISILFVSCINTNERDIFSFRFPLTEVEDSIKVMNNLLSNYQEVNYYIDDDNVLFIGTNKVGKINSLSLVQLRLNQSNYSSTDIRIFAIILFLKNNYINSCFRHKELGIIVYDYKPTKDDRFEDVRYIILDDGRIDTTSKIFRNSQKILVKKNKLMLIAPIDKRN